MSFSLISVILAVYLGYTIMTFRMHFKVPVIIAINKIIYRPVYRTFQGAKLIW